MPATTPVLTFRILFTVPYETSETYLSPASGLVRVTSATQLLERDARIVKPQYRALTIDPDIGWIDVSINPSNDSPAQVGVLRVIRADVGEAELRRLISISCSTAFRSRLHGIATRLKWGGGKQISATLDGYEQILREWCRPLRELAVKQLPKVLAADPENALLFEEEFEGICAITREATLQSSFCF